MTVPALPVLLRSVARISTDRARSAEPISIGVPLPRGLVVDPELLSLDRADGRPAPLQVRAVDRWPDGSIRWVLLDFLADSVDGEVEVRLSVEPNPRGRAHPIPWTSTASGVEVDTGPARFQFSIGAAFPLSGVLAADGALETRAGLTVDLGGGSRPVRLTSARVVESGPVRVSVEVNGAVEGDPSLAFDGRVDVYTSSGVARVSVTSTNPRRARHPGGQWGLGDAGSVLISTLALEVPTAQPFTRVTASLDRGAAPVGEALPFHLLQESSGGDNWRGPVHRTRSGDVALRFRGYRVRSGETERAGDRAWPVVAASAASLELAVAVPKFWQNFPGAIDVTSAGLQVGFLPSDSAAPHELQGGEARTFTAVFSFGGEPLGWVHEPQVVFPPADWCCATGAVPFLVHAAADPSDTFLELSALGLDAAAGFVAKRELADEYGWRNFGDLPADHESAFRPAGDPFVSHYNNQYDALAGFAMQFLRTGDRRWWDLMDDLARHVRDIDIYHTTEDRAAYNGGLFWHTAHYVDAGLSTHRTYPPGGASGGGPSAEHNYNVGLMLHTFLTGDDASRRAAIGLGRWVINMDDGRQTMFRWLASGPTGSANFTNNFYGPGRGAGHSVLACLVAYRLSDEQAYLAKAEELIARTIHPADDPEALELLDAERRWSYTAFLQALGVYLYDRAERGVADDAVEYARASLVHYARWMLGRERPYLDRPDELEYPTETWAAQDLRKGDVLLWAALVGPGQDRQAFLDGAHRYFAYAFSTLRQMPTRHFTRPLVIVLSHGVRHGWLLSHAEPPALFAGGALRFEPERHPKLHFEPQRTIAMRRARFAAGGAIALALLLALYIAW